MVTLMVSRRLHWAVQQFQMCLRKLSATMWWQHYNPDICSSSSSIRCLYSPQMFLFAKISDSHWWYLIACLGGAVGSVAVRAAWLRWSASLGSRPRLARSLHQVIAAYALRLNSRAGTEGSTLSSLICDRWLILGSETLSISRCLNHW